MGNIMLVTSGKGGTGKSTVALNLGLSLSKEGKKMFKEDYPSITAVMRPETKTKLDVILNVDPETGKAN